jgi:hypothetical protein
MLMAGDKSEVATLLDSALELRAPFQSNLAPVNL